MLSRYRQLVGILRWTVELDRLDNYVEDALLSQYLACPQEGHLEELYHIFAYLKRRPVAKIVLDPTTVTLDEDAFHNVDLCHGENLRGREGRIPSQDAKVKGKSCQNMLLCGLGPCR